jgi:hypothetical protein
LSIWKKLTLPAFSWEEASLGINKIDKELGGYMQHAESKFRQIKSDRIPFSPEAALWIKQTQVYQSLLKYQAGRIDNRWNLKQASWSCGIEDAMSISQGEIKVRLRTCIERCKHYRKHGQSYSWKHLNSCLVAANEEENEDAEKQILAIIQQEKDITVWRRINYGLGNARHQ